MVLSTAALSWEVWRTSAWAGTQSCPLASESSFAAFVILSELRHNTKYYSSDGPRKENRIWAVSRRTYFLPTITAFAPCFICAIQSVLISKLTSNWMQKHTIASVMPRQMPEPPPVQKSTFPLKMSGLNTAVEYTALVALDISTQWCLVLWKLGVGYGCWTRCWGVESSGSNDTRGRGIYVYLLPHKFPG